MGKNSNKFNITVTLGVLVKVNDLYFCIKPGVAVDDLCLLDITAGASAGVDPTGFAFVELKINLVSCFIFSSRETLKPSCSCNSCFKSSNFFEISSEFSSIL